MAWLLRGTVAGFPIADSAILPSGRYQLSTDLLNYPQLLHEAMLGMVRQAIGQVADHGFPGEHHFYLQFSTQHPDVVLPGFLRDRFPEEMTIILQHQYWDLEVEEQSFSVSLRFDGAPHRLVIPFAGLLGFLDPAADLALRFDRGLTLPGGGDTATASPDGALASTPPDGAKVEAGKVVDFEAFRRR